MTLRSTRRPGTPLLRLLSHYAMLRTWDYVRRVALRGSRFDTKIYIIHSKMLKQLTTIIMSSVSHNCNKT